MTAAVDRRRSFASRWRAFVAASTVAVAIILGILGPGGVARADRPVSFDDAGSAPQISIVGDSTLSAVRWYSDYGPLERFNFVLSAESCRRTIEQSCISREGYRSDNVITAIRSIHDDLGEVLVVMSGYNDPIHTIDEAIEGVVDEARSHDVDHVVWLSLRTSPDVDYSDPQEQSSIETFREYNQQLFDAAEASDGYLQVADWAAYSNGASDWFEDDGVHLTPAGVDAVTTFLAGTVERVLAGENVSPAAAPWTTLVPGAEGADVAAVQRALIDAGIDVPGGADGVFGYDTMAAVSAYQRGAGDLQVTGAVDITTARALGVYVEETDDAEADDLATDAFAARDAATPIAVPDQTDTSSTGSIDAAPQMLAATRVGVPRWALAVAAVVVATGLAVILRRRHVVARRAARRRSRVHPAASPQRSIADMRRAGALGPMPQPGVRAPGERPEPVPGR